MASATSHTDWFSGQSTVEHSEIHAISWAALPKCLYHQEAGHSSCTALSCLKAPMCSISHVHVHVAIQHRDDSKELLCKPAVLHESSAEMLSKLRSYPALPLPPAQCRASAVKWGFLLKQDMDWQHILLKGLEHSVGSAVLYRAKAKGA